MLNGVLGAIDVGPWALDVALKATVLLALGGMAAVVLRRAAPAMRHAVWASALVGILVVPLASVAPGWRVLPGWVRVNPKVSAGESSAMRPPETVVEPTTQVPSALDREAVNVAQSGDDTDSPRAPDALQAADAPPAMRVEQPASAARVPTNSPPSGSAISWAAWATAAWMVGMAAMLLPLAVAMVALRRMRRAARGVDEPAGGQALEDVKGTLGVNGRVDLLISDACMVPMTFGIVRPCIVVPAASATWSLARWKMILTHELAHVRRRDVACMWVGQLARAVYWFHPLAWVAYQRMGIESEKACDDGVIVAGSAPGAYAAVLLEIAEGSRRRSLMKFAVLHMARPSTLETRVRAVLDGRRRRQASVVQMLALVAAAGLFSAGMGVLRAAENAADAGHVAPSPATAPAAAAAAAATTQEVSDPAHPLCKLPNGATLELMAISSGNRGPWWDATGAPLAVDWVVMYAASFGGGRGAGTGAYAGGPPGFPGGDDSANPERVLIFKLVGMPADEVRFRVGGHTYGVSPKSVYGPGEDRQYGALVDDLFVLRAIGTTPPSPPKATESFRLGVVVEPWKTLADMPVGTSGKADGGEYSVGEARLYRLVPQQPGPMGGFGGRVRGPAATAPATTAPASEPITGASVHLTETFDLADAQTQYSGLDSAGKVITADGGAAVDAQMAALRSVDVAFRNRAPGDIKAIRLAVRHYHWVDFTNVAMYPRGSGPVAVAGLPTDSSQSSRAPTSVVDANRRGAPVFSGSDPVDIPEAEQLRTQIMPLQNLDPAKLVNDLRPMISQDADVVANAASRSLIITDTAAHIHRLALIIQELDRAATSVENVVPQPAGVPNIAGAASDAEAEAMLALAKNRADDLSEVNGQETILKMAQDTLTLEEARNKIGTSQPDALAAARMRLATHQLDLEAARHRHDQAVLEYRIAQAQFDARRAATTPKH